MNFCPLCRSTLFAWVSMRDTETPWRVMCGNGECACHGEHLVTGKGQTQQEGISDFRKQMETFTLASSGSL